MNERMRELAGINEGKHNYKTNHKSFTSAVEEVLNFVEKNGFTVNDSDWTSQVTFGGRTGRGRPPVGKSNSFNVGLFKGDKEIKKQVHFQVYGLESGSYELNMYIR